MNASRTLAAVVVVVVLTACTGEEEPLGRVDAANGEGSIALGESRNALLADWLVTNSVTNLGRSLDALPDFQIDPQLLPEGLAALTVLLPDQPYTLVAEMDDFDRQRVTELRIGPKAEMPVGGEPERSEEALPADSLSAEDRGLIAALENADADDQITLLDGIELDPQGIDLLSTLLRHSASEETRLATVARLDLGDELGAKQLLLDALNDPSSSVALRALESVERWQDRSTLRYVEPLARHSDPLIAQAATDFVEGLTEYADVSGPLEPTPVADSYRSEALSTDAFVEQQMERAKQAMQK